jgi:protoporphyrinogen oxidase
MTRIGVSYLRARLHPIRDEVSLEDFMVNRFGRELYATFFEDYTEKVWGVPPSEITADWGAQRIKGLSISKALLHAARSALRPARRAGDIYQRGTETSLIERFLYPKRGPGQLWEEVTRRIVERGGQVILDTTVVALHVEDDRVVAASVRDAGGNVTRVEGDYFFSTIPIRELIAGLDAEVPERVRAVAAGLQYRDFITVGLLADRLKVREPDGGLLKDTWIYIQEPDVLLGRLQIFNNWSPYLVSDPSKVWIGLEYFCYDTDDLWKMADDDLKKFAIAEVSRIGILEAPDVSDAHVVRVPKTYPAYFGTYSRFDELKDFSDRIENLFLVGRNGMHKYNNQDHSMLTAMHAVDGIVAGKIDKKALWEINTEQEYHEEKGKK